MNLRELTEEEKLLCKAEGLDPEPFLVRYKTDYAINLRNPGTGTDIIIYWGLRNA